MTCHDFQRKWDELLDLDAGQADTVGDAGSRLTGPDRDPTPDELESRLLAHAADCPACRPIAVRYQTLRHAIRAWRRPPVPSTDLVQRVLSAPAETSPRIWQIPAARARRLWQDRESRRRLLLRCVAASAMIVLLVGETLIWNNRRHRQDRPLPVHQVFDQDLHSIAAPEMAPEGSIALNRALTEATFATLDLARSASEPAARISRDMLDAAEQTKENGPHQPAESSVTASAGRNEGFVGLSMPLPSLDPLAPETTAASRVLQQVGDHLSAGAAPLSSTARHAFGFLLGPPRVPAGSRAARSTSTGA